jgi:hypothetical protein
MTMPGTIRLWVLAAALGLSAPAAWAGDGKRYTGASCRGATAADDIGLWWGRAYNNSSRRQATAYCAVVREKGDVGDDWIQEAEVDVYDHSQVYDVTCTLGAVNPGSLDGGIMLTYQRKSTQGFATGTRRIEFGKMKAYPWEGHVIYCSLPPREQGLSSEITGYKVVEQ